MMTEALSKRALEMHDRGGHPAGGLHGSASTAKRTVATGVREREATASERRSDWGGLSLREGADGAASPGGQKQSLATLMRIKRSMTRWRSSKLGSVSVSSRERAGKAHPVVVENNYKMAPDDSTHFRSAPVRAIMEEIVKRYMEAEENYDVSKTPSLARLISEEIKLRVKELSFKRFKYSCYVVIGQNVGQGMEVASRAVWDGATDRAVHVSFTTGDMYAVALFFAVYCE